MTSIPFIYPREEYLNLFNSVMRRIRDPSLEDMWERNNSVQFVMISVDV